MTFALQLCSATEMIDCRLVLKSVSFYLPSSSLTLLFKYFTACPPPTTAKMFKNKRNNQWEGPFCKQLRIILSVCLSVCSLCQVLAAKLMNFLCQILQKHTVAKLRSLQGHGAGSWLDNFPSYDKHTLKPNEFCIV